jgi:hypothetical protein
LRSLLEALEVPLESQVLVFSQTSSQAKLISPENPRAIYFSDDVAIGWVRRGPVLEIAATDPETGPVFYTLDQSPSARPQFERNDACLSCHQSRKTDKVPGWMVLSTFDTPGTRKSPFDNFVSDHSAPLNKRWGGWYVTGLSTGFQHMGNRVGQGWIRSLYDQFDTSGYLTEYSDVVALMTLEHQVRATNLITRLSRDARTDHSIEISFQSAINDLVDYLLFVDEAPFRNRIIGTSGYTDKFSKLGPHDGKGRSFRQFDLTYRLMRFPCSYMIYSEAFDALPSSVKSAIYSRMWTILSARSQRGRYQRLSDADRKAIIEILTETKHDLPPYFKPLS